MDTLKLFSEVNAYNEGFIEVKWALLFDCVLKHKQLMQKSKTTRAIVEELSHKAIREFIWMHTRSDQKVSVLFLR